MSAVLKFPQSLQMLECCGCYMSFGMPAKFIQDRRDDHKTFYCPYGHPNYYPSKSDAEKLRDQLATTEKKLEVERNWHVHYQEQSAHNERRLRATKAVVTKTKARIAAGKCPCCTKQFSDLQGHMNEKHPEYGKAGE